jgi:para-nitrobenzyl esterase
MGGLFKAAHALEIPFVFNNPDISPFTGTGDERYELARAMSSAWANFARTGDPNGPGLPTWPAYDATKRATMIFDVRCSVEDDPRRAEREVWEGRPAVGL